MNSPIHEGHSDLTYSLLPRIVNSQYRRKINVNEFSASIHKFKNYYRGLHSLSDWTQRIKTRIDDSHASPGARSGPAILQTHCYISIKSPSM